MSSRDKILNDIKANQPELIPLPSWTWPSSDQNVETFMRSLKSIGGTPLRASSPDFIENDIIKNHGDDKRIVTSSPLHLVTPTLKWTVLDRSRESIDSMEQIEVTIIEGQLGVAENGAIWVDESSMGHRVLPFICQHLVIILREQSIVSNMHEAYGLIDVSKPGFGAFIAGPSKTADIEQSLVIGAHGARSLTVYIV